MNNNEDKTSAIHTIIHFPMNVNTLRVDAICVALLCSFNSNNITINCTILFVVEVSRGVFIDLIDRTVKLTGPNTDNFINGSAIHLNTSIKCEILFSKTYLYNPLLGCIQRPTALVIDTNESFKISQSLMDQIDDVSNLHLCICSVCYVLTNVRPLGCHHNICLKCILKLQEKKCPQCRKEFQYICNNKLDLWNNHLAIFNWNDKNTTL